MKTALVIVAVVFVFFSILSFVAISILFRTQFGRVGKTKYSTGLWYEDVEEKQERELLSFPSGKNKLQGYLY